MRGGIEAVGLEYERFVVTDENLFRPAEARSLVGDASKAERTFGWRPGIEFGALVREMIENDCRLVGREI